MQTCGAIDQCKGLQCLLSFWPWRGDSERIDMMYRVEQPNLDHELLCTFPISLPLVQPQLRNEMFDSDLSQRAFVPEFPIDARHAYQLRPQTKLFSREPAPGEGTKYYDFFQLGILNHELCQAFEKMGGVDG
jgi:hypothetical protein